MPEVESTRASGSSAAGASAASMLSSLMRPRIADRLVDTSLNTVQDETLNFINDDASMIGTQNKIKIKIMRKKILSK
jgi:hypothetical protein